ncbi:MAG TPA: pseudouridine-5'-phosphate glycosidase [Anaeromyxobacteraceae bacterium]|nr:pseudouridine-5'-phosphate glycosidase [Anaeromyxobacteraceae bacterium]
MDDAIRFSGELRAAMAEGRPVVALETSVVAHGLPSPLNLEAARRCAAAVRGAGAVPAFVGVVAGQIVAGVEGGELERLAAPASRPAKAQARDLAALIVTRKDAGTTVSATVAVAALLGIRVVATGGIGGVHRVPAGEPAAAAGDVSADLDEVARQPVCVVSSGPKAVLDVAATAEALETRGIPAVGLGTGEMPAFYADSSGVSLEHRVADEREVAALLQLHWGVLGRREGVLLLVPPPRPIAREVIEAAVAGGLAEAHARGVRGKDVTPVLLDAVSRATGGKAREANLALLERNAEVAGRLAVAIAARAAGGLR